MSEIKSAKRTRCTWSAVERAEWVALFERSGRSLVEFCRENDLAKTTLSLWQRQLRAGGGATSEEASLVEVPVAQLNVAAARDAADTAPAAVKIRLPSGLELEVVAGTDALWLAGLLRALQRAVFEPCWG